MGSTAKRTPSLLAAVDLGSNSFHMVIAREVRGELQVVDRLKERVQLAAGLTEEGVLDEASQERAFATLERFGQRLRGVAPERIRAVGTSALRQARNARPPACHLHPRRHHHPLPHHLRRRRHSRAGRPRSLSATMIYRHRTM